MPRVALVVLGVAVVVMVACQLVLPPLAERRVEDRLERDGGNAEASLSALPAPRLLFGDGDSFEVRGRGLSVDLSRQEPVLDRLDGFGEVDVRLTDVDAGPVAVSRFDLLRGEGDEAYAVRMTGETTPRDVASFLGSQTGGLLGGVLGDLAAGGLPGGGTIPVPVDVRASVESRDGEPKVTSSRGSVGGVPGGPLLELVVEAVVRQL
jgi:hypothetical protein